MHSCKLFICTKHWTRSLLKLVSHWDAINWRLVGDKSWRCKCDISTIFSCSLTDNCTHDKYATVARHSHDTRTNHWRFLAPVREEFVYMSRTCLATVVRHSRDTRAKLARRNCDNLSFSAYSGRSRNRRTNVARPSCDGRANVARCLCEKMINDTS